MKKMAFVIILGLAIWQLFYQAPPQPERDNIPSIASFFHLDDTTSGNTTTRTLSNFVCDSRQLCHEMTTQAEAAFFYQHCPDQQLQLDPDGTPCRQFFE